MYPFAAISAACIVLFLSIEPRGCNEIHFHVMTCGIPFYVMKYLSIEPRGCDEIPFVRCIELAPPEW